MAVAIVMATYDGEKYIIEQINSIISQTYKDWKLFIHDDGSTDNTVEIISQFTKSDSRIHLIKDGLKFHNSTANFIHLLKLIPNDFNYICLCDQDDVWEVNKIELCLGEMEKIPEKENKPVCISTDLSLINQEGIQFEHSFWKYSNMNLNSNYNFLMVENTATGCTMMFNRKVLDYIFKLSNEEILKIIQHDWYIALICASDGVYKQLAIQTMRYRQHSNNVVGARKTSIINKLSPKSFITSLKRIKKLKKKVKEQLTLVEKNITNEENKTITEQYIQSNGIFHKIIMIINGICSDSSFGKKIIKLIMY